MVVHIANYMKQKRSLYPDMDISKYMHMYIEKNEKLW